MNTREFEEPVQSPSRSGQGSSGPLVGMIACSLALLLMITACSPAARAQSIGGEPPETKPPASFSGHCEKR